MAAARASQRSVCRALLARGCSRFVMRIQQTNSSHTPCIPTAQLSSPRRREILLPYCMQTPDPARGTEVPRTQGGARRKKRARRVRAFGRGARQRGCVAFPATFGSGASSMPASNPRAASALFFAPLIFTIMVLLSVSCAVSDATCSRAVASSCRALFSSSRRAPLSVSSLEISACAVVGRWSASEMGHVRT